VLFYNFLGALIGHDAGHFAVSRIPIVNDICLWCIGLICNPITWQHQHTYGHHSFTNLHDQDPDLHHFHILMRYNKNEKFVSLYKNQKSFMYIMFVYSMGTFGLCHLFVYRFILERSMHGTVAWSDRHRLLRTLGLWFHLILYTAIVTVWPFFVMSSSWHAFWAGFLHQLTSGMIFNLLTQVGHIHEHCLDTDVLKENRHPIAKESWAADQIETTNDFAPQSMLWFYVGGQLTLQIEHHLFPSLEFNVKYKKYDSFREVFNDTIKYIQSLSVDINHRQYIQSLEKKSK
jgi:fatty acid desaturase